MARLAALSLFLFISWEMIARSTQQREVLIRDRLVLVLCDQIHEYLNGPGTYPPAIKKMPEKYKKVKPGQAGSMNGFQVVLPEGTKRKREAHYYGHPILDFLDV